MHDWTLEDEQDIANAREDIDRLAESIQHCLLYSESDKASSRPPILDTCQDQTHQRHGMAIAPLVISSYLNITEPLGISINSTTSGMLNVIKTGGTKDGSNYPGWLHDMRLAINEAKDMVTTQSKGENLYCSMAAALSRGQMRRFHDWASNAIAFMDIFEYLSSIPGMDFPDKDVALFEVSIANERAIEQSRADDTRDYL